MTELENKVGWLLQAKAQEEVAKKVRIEAEEAIAALIPGPERGSKTVTFEDGTKVRITRGFNYKADLSEIENMFLENYPVSPPIKIKTTRELDQTGYHWFESEHPELFRELCKYVVVTPKKISVEIIGSK